MERIRDAAFSLERKSEVGIIICSALKKNTEISFVKENGNVKFLFLEGSFELVLERMKQRKGHYMKTDMLKVSLRHWKCQVNTNRMLFMWIFQEVLSKWLNVV